MTLSCLNDRKASGNPGAKASDKVVDLPAPVICQKVACLSGARSRLAVDYDWAALPDLVEVRGQVLQWYVPCSGNQSALDLAIGTHIDQDRRVA